MISMLLGMLGAALMLLAFRLGMKVGEGGRRGLSERQSAPGAAHPEQREEDERRAFEELMGYNVETAYGMRKGADEK